MNLSLIPTDLRPIAEKVESRQRISEADALSLYRSNDLNALGIMASAVREQKNGNIATYILNRYVNYSNLCILSCQFCAFAAKKRDAHAFERSIDDIVAAVEESLGAEHRACREAVALFDESSFAKLEVSGPGSASFLERLTANRVAELVSGMQLLVDAALAHRTLDDILEDLIMRVRGVLQAGSGVDGGGSSVCRRSMRKIILNLLVQRAGISLLPGSAG